MPEPLLELVGLRRDYPSGDQVVAALDGIDIAIEAGEMVAIVGASGSGKSTLMNILGCLDRPTGGAYRVGGRETSSLAPDELAKLRREHFGFIFQRYHLLPDLDALGNVEVPSIYAGTARRARRERAISLLHRLGLDGRMHHRPSQLSGGQQQRVSIARALMNGGQVILADEPTGALDRQTGQQMLGILEALHRDGHTIIIVTHDQLVASHAERVIELSDGCVVADRRRADSSIAPERAAPPQSASWRAQLDRLLEAAYMALLAMNAHRLRTFLTMLGIVIGIASVISVVALGEGSRQRILADINSIGTNTLDIYPGADFGDIRASAVQTLRPEDAALLAEQDYVDSVTPVTSTSVVLRYRNIAANAQVNGVGEQFFRVRGMNIAAGEAFDRADVHRLAQNVVIDENTKKKLFPDGGNPVGAVVLLGSVPCRIIGVAERKQNGFNDTENLNVWAPYTTVMGRFLGEAYLKSMTVRVSDSAPMEAAKAAVTQVLTLRHGRKDFYVSDTDTIRKTVEKTTATMTLMIAMIAVISLVVGGIGVMNITLVSVTERTQEIGVRMAVGARRSDIMSQFLIEAVLVCLFGGVLGIALAMAVGMGFAGAGASFTMVFSPAAIVLAFVCSTLIGLVFGFLPARNAARLDPVEALARE